MGKYSSRNIIKSEEIKDSKYSSKNLDTSALYDRINKWDSSSSAADDTDELLRSIDSHRKALGEDNYKALYDYVNSKRSKAAANDISKSLVDSWGAESASESSGNKTGYSGDVLPDDDVLSGILSDPFDMNTVKSDYYGNLGKIAGERADETEDEFRSKTEPGIEKNRGLKGFESPAQNMNETLKFIDQQDGIGNTEDKDISDRFDGKLDIGPSPSQLQTVIQSLDYPTAKQMSDSYTEMSDVYGMFKGMSDSEVVESIEKYMSEMEGKPAEIKPNSDASQNSGYVKRANQESAYRPVEYDPEAYEKYTAAEKYIDNIVTERFGGSYTDALEYFKKSGTEGAVKDFERYFAQQLGDEEAEQKIAEFEKVKGNSDFEEKSKYDPEVNDITYDHVNHPGFVLGRDNPQVFDSESKYAQMNEDERSIYNYLYKQSGQEIAEDYIDALDRKLNSRVSENAITMYTQFSDNYPIASSAISVPLSLLGGVTGSADYVFQTVKGVFTGDRLDNNTPAQTLSKGSETIRSNVSSDLTEEYGSWAGQLYNIGMSVADNAARAAIGAGIGSTVGLSGQALSAFSAKVSGAIMALQVAPSAISEGLKKGYSSAKALTMGIVQAAIEGITEKYSLEVIMGNPKKLIPGLLKSFAAEGSEEIASNWLNAIADKIANGTESDFNKSIRAYLSAGMSYEKALEQTIFDSLKDDAEAFIQGGFAGLILGGGYAAWNSTKVNSEYKSKGKDIINGNVEGITVDKLISEGMKTKDSEVMKLIPELQSKKDRGEISKKDAKAVGRLYYAVADAQLRQYRKDTVSALTKEGMTQADAENIVSVMIGGEGATKSQVNKAIAALDSAGLDIKGGVIVRTDSASSAETAAAQETQTDPGEVLEDITDMSDETGTSDKTVAQPIEEADYAAAENNEVEPIQEDEYVTKESNKAEYSSAERDNDRLAALDNVDTIYIKNPKSSSVRDLVVSLKNGGKALRITGIVDNNGETIVETSDGERHAISDLDFGGHTVAQTVFASIPEGLSADGAATYISSFNIDTVNADTFNAGFKYFYDAGYTGAGQYNGNKLVPGAGAGTDVQLFAKKDNESAQAAYLAGRRARIQESGFEFEESDTVNTEIEYKPGLFENEYSEKLDGRMKDFLQAVGEKFGVTVIMTDTDTENGHVDGNKIYISINSKNPASVVFTHEITHYFKQTSMKLYLEYRDFIVNWYKSKHRAVFRQRIDAIKESYKAGIEKKLDMGEISDAEALELMEEYNRDDAIYDELAAKATEEFLTDEKAVEQFISGHPEAARGFIGVLKKLISDIKELVRDFSARSGIARELRSEQETYEKALNMWLGIADDVARKAENGQKNNTVRGGVRMDVNEDPAKEYADFDKPITQDDIKVLRSIGRKSINSFTDEDIIKSRKWAYKFYKELGTKSPFFRAWFGDWRARDTRSVTIAEIPEYVASNEARRKNRGNVQNADTKWDIRISREGETNTISHSGYMHLSEYGLSGIRQLIENAVLLDSEVHEHHSNNAKDDRISFDHKLYAFGIDTDGTVGLYKITVEEAFQSKKQPGEKKFHNLKYIEKVAELSADALADNIRSGGSTNDNSTTIYTVSDLYSLVKRLDEDFTVTHEVNSALLNEDGTPKVFYHGSKKGGRFTVFRDWQYFTENKPYAERYTERGNDKSLYTVYLRAEKIFDTRNAEARKIFESIRSEYGLGELQNTGLPDWTDGYDITDYLDEHPELGYDAILLDEGGDLINGKPVSRGLSIVIKDSTQIKSATDNIGTFSSNADIRFSFDDMEELSDEAQIKQAIGREESDKLERIISEFEKITPNRTVSREASDRIIDRLLDRYDSYLPYAQARRQLFGIYELMSERAGNADFDEYLRALSALGEKILGTKKENSTADDTKKAIREYLKSINISVNDEQKAEAAAVYGTSYGKFRQQNMKYLRLVNEDYTGESITLSEAFEELCRRFPQEFDPDTEVRDMLVALREKAADPEVNADPAEVRNVSYELLAGYFEATAGKNVTDSLIKSTKDKLEREREARQKDLIYYRKSRVEERLKRRETNERAKYRKSIMSTANSIVNMMNHPTDKRHIPEFLVEPYSKFFENFDFGYSDEKATQAGYNIHSHLEKLRLSLTEMYSADNYTLSDKKLEDSYVEIDPNFMDNVDDLIKRMDNGNVQRIADMNSLELRELNIVLTGLKAAANYANKFYTAFHNKTISEVTEQSIDYLSERKRRVIRSGDAEEKKHRIDGMLNYDMLLPVTYFDKFGAVGKQLFRQLQEADNKRIENLAVIQSFINKVYTETYGENYQKKIKELSEKVYTYSISGDRKVRMTKAQVMSLAMLKNRAAARKHMVREQGGDGIKIRPRGKFGQITAEVGAIKISSSDITKITNTLSDDELALAKKLQKFMANRCAEWGNEVTMKMYLYKKFTEREYFPIYTDENSRDARTEADKNPQARLSGLKNSGHTKDLNPNATNALYIDDIFKVFLDHATDMATYNAYVQILSDTLRWYNNKTFKDTIEATYGKNCEKYLITLLTDLNGQNKDQTGNFEKFVNKLIGRFKRIAVGANLRVVAQQPMAIARAAIYIDYKYLAKALVDFKSRTKHEARDKSAVVKWKTWGFLESDLANSMSSVILGDSTLREKLNTLAMAPAGKADEITWEAMRRAAKYQIADTTELKPGTKEFDGAVNALLDEVVARTQVVGGTLYTTQAMRSKSTMMKMATSFMAEPMMNYNVYYSALHNLTDAKSPAAKKAAALMFTRTLGAMAVNNILLTIVQSLIDAFRRDDEDRNYWERFLYNAFGYSGDIEDFFGSNLVDNFDPTQMIPVLKEIVPTFFGGNSVTGYTEPYLEVFNRIVNAGKSIQDLLVSEKKAISEDEEIPQGTLYDTIYKTAAAISALTGVGISNVMRDFTGLWNTIAVELCGGPKYSAENHGYTSDEKLDMMINAVLEKDSETYYKWKNNLIAMSKKEKPSEKEQDVSEKLKSRISQLIIDGELSPDDGKAVLERVTGYSDFEINKAIRKAVEGQGDQDWNAYDELFSAIESGKNIQETIDKYRKIGYTDKSIKDSITGHFKEIYAELVFSGQPHDELKARLADIYQELGDYRGQAISYINGWPKDVLKDREKEEKEKKQQEEEYKARGRW